MSLIRGVLLAGRFRSHHELNQMSDDDQRNTLIVILTALSNQSNYQSFDNATLGGMGAVLVFLRTARIRDDSTLKTMSADDQRNTLIVEIGIQLPHMASRLQGLSNIELVLLGLGDEDPSVSLRHPTFIRGVLLAGKFRTQHELNQMSAEDQRNTLIVALTALSNQSNYQSFDDHTLAGLGAALVFMRETGIRDDSALKTMSAEDQRNTLIVEVDGQTRLGSRLQELRNMDLVRIGLGEDPAGMFVTLPPPLRPHFPKYRLQFRLRGFNVFTSGDDTFQGARDEVYISALGMDSSTAHFASDGKLVVDQVESPVVGDVVDSRVTGPWAQNPCVMLEFDLNRDAQLPDFPQFPRSYVITVLVVEKDNESLADSFNELKDKVREAAQNAIRSAAAAAISSAGSSVAAGGVGAALAGALGAAGGGFAGFLVGLSLERIFTAIGEGLANEVYSPKTLNLWLPHPVRNSLPDDFDVDRPDWFEIKEHGAFYRIHYDWHIEWLGND